MGIKTFNIEQLRSERLPIHEKCVGCNHVEEASGLCNCYINPSEKWRERSVATEEVVINHKTLETEERPARVFFCPLATHIKADKSSAKSKINPLKASKRGNR